MKKFRFKKLNVFNNNYVVLENNGFKVGKLLCFPIP